MKNQVISLYDLTGEALRPWAEAGYECFAYDIQHEGRRTEDGITYVHADLHDSTTLLSLIATHTAKACFMSAFPPCTDLAVSGARWWKKKAEENSAFQTEAARHVKRCHWVGVALKCPFYIENPIGALSRLWRKPDHKFDPCDFGGYLPKDDVHPLWPEVIPPRDAYRKRTCLWTGGGFEKPSSDKVIPETVVYARKDPTKGENFSPVLGKTGGKSLKTKNIRSATPRGFAKAVFLANIKERTDD
jgi:hypothetical protein|tara:strand:+ start:690 stop:1424 length:735 start_codon:yes stop_codon:yes gene_type:complete